MKQPTYDSWNTFRIPPGVSPREPPRQTPGLSPSSFGQKTRGQDARHSNESLAISGFSRVMFDGLWNPNILRIFQRNVFTISLFEGGSLRCLRCLFKFCIYLLSGFFLSSIFGPCHGPFNSLDFHRVPHCQGIPQCRDHHSEVMYPVRMIRKHAYMSNTNKKLVV